MLSTSNSHGTVRQLHPSKSGRKKKKSMMTSQNSSRKQWFQHRCGLNWITLKLPSCTKILLSQGSFHCGTAETNLPSIHEDVGSIPGLTQ